MVDGLMPLRNKDQNNLNWKRSSSAGIPCDDQIVVIEMVQYSIRYSIHILCLVEKVQYMKYKLQVSENKNESVVRMGINQPQRINDTCIVYSKLVLLRPVHYHGTLFRILLYAGGSSIVSGV